MPRLVRASLQEEKSDHGSAAPTAHGRTLLWLGWLGLVAGVLLLLTPLAVTVEVLFLPFFFGAILTIAWLLAAGLWLALRPPVAERVAA
jgi:hypothetical protein